VVVDDLVLVKDENLPPMKGPFARVIELLFGGDGVARVAVLKTASGVTKLAVNKLCLHPLKDDVETQASNGGACRVTQPQQLINLIRSLTLIASRKVALSI